MNYGGFWRRVWAYTIDSLIVFVVTIPVLAVYLLAIDPPATEATVGAMQGLGLLVGWVYWAGLESSEHRATWGKRALGLAVVDENGERIGFGQASGRFWGKLLSAVVLVGLLLPAFRRDRRALHDLLASTFVVGV